jgi:hypothetical protein
MIQEMLKTAGVENMEDFYKLHPTEEHFFKTYPHMKKQMKKTKKVRRPKMGYGGMSMYEPGGYTAMPPAKAPDMFPSNYQAPAATAPHQGATVNWYVPKEGQYPQAQISQAPPPHSGAYDQMWLNRANVTIPPGYGERPAPARPTPGSMVADNTRTQVREIPVDMSEIASKHPKKSPAFGGNLPTVHVTAKRPNKANDIKEFQRMLNEQTGSSLAVDGMWGPKTQAAYERYMGKKNLTAMEEMPMNAESRIGMPAAPEAMHYIPTAEPAATPIYGSHGVQEGWSNVPEFNDGGGFHPDTIQGSGYMVEVPGSRHTYMSDAEKRAAFEMMMQSARARASQQGFPPAPARMPAPSGYNPMNASPARMPSSGAPIPLYFNGASPRAYGGYSFAEGGPTEEQEIAMRNAAQRAADEEGAFTFPNGTTKKYNDMNWKEKSYVHGLSLKNKGRFSPEENAWYDEYANPLNWLYSMAGNLGTAAYESDQSGSYMPYVTSIGKPLAAGALAAWSPAAGGAMSAGEMVNNRLGQGPSPVAGQRPLTLGNSTPAIIEEGTSAVGEVVPQFFQRSTASYSPRIAQKMWGIANQESYNADQAMNPRVAPTPIPFVNPRKNPTPAPAPKKGEDNKVMEYQKYINSQIEKSGVKYPKLVVDGMWGNKTQDAYEKFVALKEMKEVPTKPTAERVIEKYIPTARPSGPEQITVKPMDITRPYGITGPPTLEQWEATHPMKEYGGYYAQGGINNPGFRALPESVQQKIMDNMAYGGEYAQGGIHINPAKKGTFTAQATRMNMGVQEAARHILANKDRYSPAMVKKANFARNASKWKHDDGGYVNMYQDGGEAQQEGGASQEQMLQQLMQMVSQALGQGHSPQEVMQMLVQQGIPQETATQIIQAAGNQ